MDCVVSTDIGLGYYCRFLFESALMTFCDNIGVKLFNSFEHLNCLVIRLIIRFPVCILLSVVVGLWLYTISEIENE